MGRNGNSGWRTPLDLTASDFSKVLVAGIATVAFAWWHGVDPVPDFIDDAPWKGLGSGGGFHARRDFVEKDEPVLMGRLSEVATFLGIPTADEMDSDGGEGEQVSADGIRRRRYSQQLRASLMAAERRHAHAERSLASARSQASALQDENGALQSHVGEMQRALSEQTDELRRLRLALADSATASVSVADDLIEAAEADLRGARFEGAIELVEAARRALSSTDEPGRYQRLARLEVARATAEVALGRSADAVASMMRALDADPKLSLDDATSPKLLRAFDEARSRRP
jgi:tetratricopeptide (TPR) repeat protein